MIRAERPSDLDGIRGVNRLAFGGEDGVGLVHALRDGGFARVSLIATIEDQVVGHILFSELPIITSGGRVEALSLAPLAVAPSHQKQGIGTLLINEKLRFCRETGHPNVVVLGHTEFYALFGFSAKMAETLKSRDSGPAFMALELVPGALDGIEGEVRYSPPFGEL